MSDELSKEEKDKISKIYWTMSKELLLPISRVDANVNQNIDHMADQQSSKYTISKFNLNKASNPNNFNKNNTNPNNLPNKNVSFNNNVNTRVQSQTQPNNYTNYETQERDDPFNLNVSAIQLDSPLHPTQQPQNQPNQPTNSSYNHNVTNLSMDSMNNNSWLRFQNTNPGINRNISIDDLIFEEMYADAQAKGELDQGVNTVQAFKNCLRLNLTDLQIIEVQKKFKAERIQSSSANEPMNSESIEQDSNQREDSVDSECCICKESNNEMGDDVQSDMKEGIALNSCWHYYHLQCLVKSYKTRNSTEFKCAVCNQLLNHDDFNQINEFVSKQYEVNSFNEYMQ